VCLSGDGTRAISGHHDGTIRLWDATMIQPYETAISPCITRISVSIAGRRAISTSLDGTVRLWHLTDGTMVGGALSHMGDMREAILSTDGTRALTCLTASVVRLSDARTGEVIKDLALGEGANVRDWRQYWAVFAPDGSKAVVMFRYRTLRTVGCGDYVLNRRADGTYWRNTIDRIFS
jgi:WD40 repeat protein